MSVNPTSPVTGATVTGLTSPTYTLTEDTPPNSHSKQWAVTSLGGTQSGVETNKVSSPFTLTFERPAQLKSGAVANPTSGVISNNPNNVYKVRVRKGVNLDAAGDNIGIASAELIIRVPAHADVEDKLSVRAMLSCMWGFLSTDSADAADVPINGIL